MNLQQSTTTPPTDTEMLRAYSEETGAAAELQSVARREMIEAGGRFCQVLGLPRSTGQIYGLLYMATHPMSLDDVVKVLSISKGSASMGTRQLLQWGAIKQVWMPGDRKDYFEVIPEIGALLRASYLNMLKPRLAASKSRLIRLAEGLEEDKKSGVMNGQEYRHCQKRLKSLEQFQKKMAAALPLVEKLL